jgi:hypothetical protein
MSPNTESVLAECPDSAVVMARDDGQFIVFTLDETVQRATELADKGYRVAGCLATLLDGDVGCFSEPGYAEVCGRAFAAFLAALAEQKPKPKPVSDAVVWLNSLFLLKDTR